MNLLYKEKTKVENGILSTIRPTTLKTTPELKTSLQTNLILKRIVKIYKNGDKFYIDLSAAYALGLINTRIMMTSNIKYVEINSNVHNALKNDDKLEIQYVDMAKNNGVLSTPNLDTMPQLRQNDISKMESPKIAVKVYEDGGKHYIDYSTAYFLRIVKIRPIHLNKQPHFLEITDEVLNKLKNDDRLELEIKQIEKKLKLIVYTSENNFYIDNSAAYALGFISVEEFYNDSKGYYQINEAILKRLSITYQIEMGTLNLQLNSSAKTK